MIAVPDGVERVVRFPPNPVKDYTVFTTWRDSRGDVVYRNTVMFGETEPIETTRLIPPGRYTNVRLHVESDLPARIWLHRYRVLELP